MFSFLNNFIYLQVKAIECFKDSFDYFNHSKTRMNKKRRRTPPSFISLFFSLRLIGILLFHLVE
jgi:hypothetical protein